VSPDLAGFGQSDKPALRYDREFHLANLEALVDTFGSEAPVVLVGHSVGGVLAALWAVRHPERISGLALVSTPVPREGIVPPPALRIAHSPPDDRGSEIAMGVVRTVWPLVHLAARASRRYPREVISDYGRQSIAARADTMWTLLGDLSIERELENLRDLSPAIPTLLLSAGDDPHSGEAELGEWQRLLPGAEIKMVPTGGHQFLLRNGFEPLADWLNR
jgi:pimeloyl-ACP methyl ester carboxylesterase